MDTNLETKGRIVLNGVDRKEIQFANGVWERAIPIDTTKGTTAQLKPTRKVWNLWNRPNGTHTDSSRGSVTVLNNVTTVNVQFSSAWSIYKLTGAVDNTNISASLTDMKDKSAGEALFKSGHTYVVKLFDSTTDYYDIQIANTTNNLTITDGVAFTPTADFNALWTRMNMDGRGSQTGNKTFKIMIVESTVVPTTYYPAFSPSTVLPSLTPFGGTPVKRKADKLWGRYVPCNGITNGANTSIDTGIKAQSNMEMLVRVKAIGGSFYLLQARESGTATIYGLSGSQTNNTITSFGLTSGITRTVGHIYTIKGTLVNGAITLYVKDETDGTEDTKTGTLGSSYTFPSSTTIKLFGDASKVDSGVTVYRAYIKINGQMAWDMYPAVDVNASNAPVAYDDVAHKASAVESGSITAGGLIQPVAYAESDGTAWADTGVKITSEDEVFLDGCVTSSGSIFLMSQGLSSEGQAYQLANTSANVLVFDIRKYTTYRVTTNVSAKDTIRNIHVKNREIFVDGVSKGTSTGTLTEPTETAKLMYSVSGSSAQKVKIAKFAVVGKCDYQPVRVGQTVELLDLVNWTFAQRTGTFTAGSDIPYSQLCADIITVNTGNLSYGAGKNKFDGSNTELQYGNRSLASTQDGYWYWATGSTCFAVPVEPNTTYTISGFNTATTIARVAVFSTAIPSTTSTERIAYDSIIRNESASPITITTGNNSTFIAIQVSASTFNATKNTLQVEEGSTATSYEPFNFGLHTDGSHKVFVGSQGVADLGTLPWSNPTSTTGMWLGQISGMQAPESASDRPNGFLISDTYMPDTQTSIDTTMHEKTALRYRSGSSVFIAIRDSRFTTSAEFKAYVSGKYLFYQRTTDASFIPPIVRDIPMLLSADSFVDIQKDADNKTEYWAVKVLDGTENISWNASNSRFAMSGLGEDGTTLTGLCTRYEMKTTTVAGNDFCFSWSSSGTLHWKDSRFANDIPGMNAHFAQALADGNPYIIIYPLAVPAVSTVSMEPVSLTQKATYLVAPEAEIPTTVKATFLGKE